MDNVKRIAALYLVLTALVVFFNLILTPVYHDGSPDYPVWKIVNYFMAAGVVMALATSYLRRRAAATPTPALLTEFGPTFSATRP